MATVRMIKGTKYADIFDSPETIKQAQSEGYSLVEASDEAKPTEEDAKENETHKASDEPKTTRTRRQ